MFKELRKLSDKEKEQIQKQLGMWLVMYKIRYFYVEIFHKNISEIFPYVSKYFKTNTIMHALFVSAPSGHGTKFSDVKHM